MDLINLQTGQLEPIPDGAVKGAIQGGGYALPPGTVVQMRDPTGQQGGPVDAAKVREYFDQGYRLEHGAESAERDLERMYGDEHALSFGLGVVDSLTGGATSAVMGPGNRQVREVPKRAPVSNVGGVVTGALFPTGAAGQALRVAKGIRGAGGLARALAAEGFAGTAFALQDEIAQTGLSDSDIDAEHVLAGGLIGMGSGGVFHGLGAAAERVAARRMALSDVLRSEAFGESREAALSKTVLREVGEQRAAGASVYEEAMTGIRREAANPEARALADELLVFRNKQRLPNIPAPWKDLPVSSEARLMSGNAARGLGKLANSPKKLMQDLIDNPKRVLGVLQEQEAAFENMLTPANRERVMAALDKEGRLGVGGGREALYDSLPERLAENRRLQAKLVSTKEAFDLIEADAAATARAGARSAKKAELEAIREMAGADKPGLGSELVRGAAFTVFTGALGPALGPAAPFAGAKLAEWASEGLRGKFNGLGAAASKTAAGVARAAEAVTKAVPSINRVAIPVGVRALNKELGPDPTFKPNLADTDTKPSRAYKKRAAEVANQMTVLPDGTVATRPDARKRFAESIRGIAAASPKLADKIESKWAKGMEFLASKLIKRPDMIQPPGPDKWQPSHFSVAAFGRYVDAVRDPVATFQRVADGTTTPEDAEAMKAVYPELFNEFRQKVTENLAVLRKTLPYQQRLSLSIMFGVPVDPAMEPHILEVLQSSFTDEPETDGGMTAPIAQQKMGSIKKSLPEPTPAQAHEG